MSRRSKRNRREREATRARQQSSYQRAAKNGSVAASTHGWILGLVLVLAIVFAYQKAWHAGYIWDDDLYVTTNKLLSAPDGLRRIWFSLDSPSQYFPLVYSTFRVERALWGLNPAGYHWVNILFHAANTLLLWRLLCDLRVPGAWFAAALFALHPVQVESVAWITERKNVLMGFFFLLSLLSWVKFVEHKPGSSWKSYLLTLIFYLLALFSKTTACTLPAALVLILWLRKEPITRRRWAQIAPFVVFGIGMGLVSIWWERYHQGTRGELFEMGFLERILIANRAIWFYLGKLIWPANLSFSYPRWTVSGSDPLQYLWVLATAGLTATVYFVRRYTGRSVEVATVFFLATLAPVLGFIMLLTFLYSLVADHYQYLACIGPLTLAAAAITNGFSFFGETKQLFLKPFVYGGILLLLGALTWRQCTMYSDEETLWRTTIARNPSSWMARNNLGALLLQERRFDEALGQYREILDMLPNDPFAHDNLATALLRKGEVGEAIAQYRKAFELRPNDPRLRFNLGSALLRQGEVDEAISHFEKALELRADATDKAKRNADVHYNLGNAFFRKRQIDEAIFHFRKAVEVRPDFADAYTNLGTVLVLQRRPGEAIAKYEKALELAPRSITIRINLAQLLATCPDLSVRNGSKALQIAQEAVQLSAGKDPMSFRVLASAYAENGEFSEAVAATEKALELAGNDSSLVDAVQREMESYRAHQRPAH